MAAIDRLLPKETDDPVTYTQAELRKALRTAVQNSIEAADGKNGSFSAQHPFQSLVEAVVLWLGESDDAESSLLRFLDVLFSATISPSEKGVILEKEFGIIRTRTILQEVETMGPFSAVLEQDVTDRVTRDITDRVTRDVTDRVTRDITDRVTKDVTAETERRGAKRLASMLLTEGKSLEDTALFVATMYSSMPRHEVEDALAAARQDSAQHARIAAGSSCMREEC